MLWELPDYVSNFMRDLEETQAWIANGGVAAPAIVAPLRIMPPNNLTLPAPSDGESEVSGSDEELLTLK